MTDKTVKQINELTNLQALGIAAVAFKNGFFIFKTTSVKPDPTAGRGTPKSSFLMTRKTCPGMSFQSL